MKKQIMKVPKQVYSDTYPLWQG